MKHENSSGIKPKILIICNYFLPGFKAGGGLRTVVHTVERFKDRFDFRVINLDHDGDAVTYTSVKIDEWVEVAEVQVYYLPKHKVKISKLRELITDVDPQLIYINSVFSILSIYCLILRKLKMIARIPVIIAPEGELSDGALQLKTAKKKTFLQFAKKIGLYKNLIWKVTAEPEKIESERLRDGAKVFTAPNMPSKSVFEEYDQKLKPSKQKGAAKMLFLSRYARKKNFKWLVDNLQSINGDLEIDVYGPIEDQVYWEETEVSIRNLPANVKVAYKGLIAHEAVLRVMFDYHFFVLPTLGENFGHVFIEALAAGCPLIISDATPWTNLTEKNTGWDLPLGNVERWNETINHCIDLDDKSYQNLSSCARQFATKWLTDPKIEESTLRVLEYGLSQTLTQRA